MSKYYKKKGTTRFTRARTGEQNEQTNNIRKNNKYKFITLMMRQQSTKVSRTR